MSTSRETPAPSTATPIGVFGSLSNASETPSLSLSSDNHSIFALFEFTSFSIFSSGVNQSLFA